MRLGPSLWAFAAGFVGAAVVVGLAARSTAKRLEPKAAAISAHLEAEGAALKRETEAYAAREQARIRAAARVSGERAARLAGAEAADDLGLTQIKADMQRLQVALQARLMTASQIAANPFLLLGR
jgi:hypothetical protein